MWHLVATVDVRGSVHHCKIHTEKSNKMQQYIKIHYFIFIWSSTCFGRHTAHHQELKTALAASGFCISGRLLDLWLLDAVRQRPVTTRSTTFHVCKTRGCQCTFRLLMMGRVSPETCWALYKYGIINFDILLHLIGFFCMNCIEGFCQIFIPLSWKWKTSGFFGSSLPVYVASRPKRESNIHSDIHSIISLVSVI